MAEKTEISAEEWRGISNITRSKISGETGGNLFANVDLAANRLGVVRFGESEEKLRTDSLAGPAQKMMSDQALEARELLKPEFRNDEGYFLAQTFRYQLALLNNSYTNKTPLKIALVKEVLQGMYVLFSQAHPEAQFFRAEIAEAYQVLGLGNIEQHLNPPRWAEVLRRDREAKIQVNEEKKR